MQRMGQATCYGSLDMLQGHWQMPLAPESQEMFTIAGSGGLHILTRFPQGVFEEKQKGFDDSITGASKECGSAALSSHNVGTYGSNIQNEKTTAATQFRDMVGGFTSYRDGVT